MDENNLPNYSIAIYVRTSDNKKKSDGEKRQDIERQITFISDYLNRREIFEFEIFSDNGVIAYNEDWNSRKEFLKLYKYCCGHHIKEIYIEDMTRFSRNLGLGIQWLEKFRNLGVKIISLKDGEIEITSEKSWMQSSIFLLFAEWECRIRSNKIKEGMEKDRLEGKNIGRPSSKFAEDTK